MATAGTAAASSTDDMFISVITEEGIQPPSPEAAIGVAHDVCSSIDGGADLYDAINSVAQFTELEFEDSAFFVGASIATYCPEHEGLIGA